MSGRIGVVIEVAVWWVVLAGVWVLSLGSVSSTELGVGAAAALVAALAAALTRHAFRGVHRPGARQLRTIVAVPRAVVSDTVHVLGHAARPRSGGTRQIAVPGGDADHAVATLVASVAPGTVVVDEERAHHRLTVHALVPEKGTRRR